MEKLKQLFANKKLIAIIAVTITAIVAMYYFVVYLPEKKQGDKVDEKSGTNKTQPTGATTSPPPTTTSGKPDYTQVPCVVYADPNVLAQEGAKCRYVAQLQRYLNKVYKAGLKVDGEWGSGTETAFVNAAFPIANLPGRSYATLTKNLYNKLGLSNF